MKSGDETLADLGFKSAARVQANTDNSAPPYTGAGRENMHNRAAGSCWRTRW